MIPEYFSQRRSFRNFSSEEISDEKLFSILENSMRAPTCGNMQLYTIIVTRDKEKKEQLNKLHYNQPAASSSPVIVTVCADFKRFSRWCELRDAVPGYDNFFSFLNALTDAVIICQQIATIAEMEGLGTCYLGTVTYNAKEISELLKLPELVIPVASIAIGNIQKNEPQVERLPLEAIVGMEKYPDFSDEEIISLYKNKEDFPLNEKFVEENGGKNLAQIFTDIRYPKMVNEELSKKFFDLLKEKKFINK